MRNLSAFQPIPAYGGLESGLVSYWKLDETSGNAADSKGSNTGTNTNVTYSDGKINNCAVFNGVSSKLDLASGVSGSTARTISAWVYPTTTTGYRCIYNSGNASGTATAFAITTNVNVANDIYLFCASQDLYTGAVLTQNTWNKVDVVYDGGAMSTSTIHIYVDGVSKSLTKVGAGTGAAATVDTNYSIGYARTSNDSFWSGNIDEVSVHNRALTQSEISAAYNSGFARMYPYSGVTKAYYPLNGNSTGLLSTGAISYWKLDESSGNASDSVGANTAVNTGVTYSAGKINNGAVFNSTDVLTVTDNSTIKPSLLSISAWINVTVPAGGTYPSIVNRQSATTTDGFELSINGDTDKVAGTIQTTGGTIGGVFDTVLSSSTWYHIVLTWDGTTLKCFINGTQEATTYTGSGAIQYTTTTNLGIGRRTTGTAWTITGTIDEVGLWGRPIIQTEITQLYNLGNSQRIDSVTDYSGNGNHGIETSITYPQGRFGQGAKFNGSTSKIVAADSSSLSLTSDHTISSWHKFSAISSVMALINKFNSSTNQQSWLYRYGDNSGTKQFLINISSNGTSNTQGTYNKTLLVDTWYNFVFVYRASAGAVDLYINGKLESITTGYPTSIFDGTAGLEIGSYENGANAVYAGIIDEVIIESRAWTAKEVETYYRKSVLNYKRGGFSSLIDLISKFFFFFR